MDISVEKIDDINFILKGSVENSLISDKVAELKQSMKDDKSDERSNQELEQQAAQQVFKEFIDAGMEKAGIKVEELLGQPGLKKYEKTDDTVYFEAELSISPEIEVAGVVLDDILPSYTKPKAKPEEVEKKMEEFASKQAPYVPIENPKALENGDVAVIDFTGYVDGKPFKGGHAERFNLTIGSGSFIKGFEEQMIGMEYGQERTVKVEFPQNYQSSELAGKEAEFVVKLHEVQEKKPITIDDAFAQKILNSQTATVEDLKQKLEEQIVSQELSQLYVSELKPKIVEGLLTKFDFTLPNNIVEQEIDAKVREKIGHLPQEEQTKYLQDKEQFFALRDSVRQEAKSTIKKALIVEALAKQENITADEQEAISALTYQAMMTGQNAQELVKHYQENNLMTSVKLALVEDKLFGKMLGFDKQR